MSASLGIVSLIALIVAIAVGCIWKSNVGIASIGLAVIISLIYGVKEKVIIDGFSGSLFVTMAGVTYLFGMLIQNGTLDKIAKMFVSVSVNRSVWFIPVVIYCLGFILSAIGPGSIEPGDHPRAGRADRVFGGLQSAHARADRGSRMLRRQADADHAGRPFGDEPAGKAEGQRQPVPHLALHVRFFLVLAALAYVYYKGWKIEKVEKQETNLQQEKSGSTGAR